jgi:NADH-quinone oxidoreductase subunit N
MHTDWVAILPEFFMAMGGFLIFCMGAFWRRRPEGSLFVVALLAVVGAGISAILVKPQAAVFTGGLDVASYGRFFTVLLSGIGAITLLFSYRYGRVRRFAGDEFYGILLFALLGMDLTACAVNWVIFFLGLELFSISLYVLIAIRKGETRSVEAGLKYLIMGAVASAFLTFGIALLYGMTGTLQVGPSLAMDLPPQEVPVILLALSLILVGIAFKISVVPFHLWTADVYQGAPAPITAFLATGSKVALFAALMRFSLHVTNPNWAYTTPALWGPLWVLAVLTMVVGNITALRQTRLKRLLAYSSIAQMGYLLMALLAIKQEALPAMMFYLTVYAVMDLGAFGILGTLSSEKADLDALEDYRGLGYSQPWRSAILAACLFSLVGMPPAAGFFGKFVLFRAVLQADFVILAIVGMLTVIVSVFYYMKVLVFLYMRPEKKVIIIPGLGVSENVACGVIMILVLWLGIAPSPFYTLVSRIAAF